MVGVVQTHPADLVAERIDFNAGLGIERNDLGL